MRIAEIAVRNFSHNVGSHVLARIHGSTLEKAEDGRAGGSKDVERFLQYLQERMDFMARVATEWPTWREPTFFYADLLRGFLRQGLLLDNLVADEGFPASKIRFHIKKGPYDTEFVRATWQASRGNDGFSEFQFEGEAKDFLVAIPGGVVGRQAFYGFLENAIRNAAKYNRGETLEVVLVVEAAQSDGIGYIVSYQDNLTKGDKLAPIQKHLERDLIDESGRLVSEGWGIQEMKTYAQYLAYPHSDWQAPNCPEKAPGPLGASAQGPLVKAKGFPGQFVTYTFGLQRPCLALVPTELVKGLDAKDLQAHGIGTYTSSQLFEDGFRDQVRKLSPGLVYLVAPAEGEKLQPFIDKIKEARLWLPARILLRPAQDNAGSSTDALNSLADGLFEALRKAGLAHWVRVDREEGLPRPANGTGADGLVVELYRRWLLALAQERGYTLPFRLVIYFDRDDDTFAKRWADLKTTTERYNICTDNFVTVYPVCKKNPGTTSPSDVTLEPWKVTRREYCVSSNQPVFGSLKKGVEGGTWLLFDNHGNGRPSDLTEQEMAFYHHVGSRPGYQNNRDLFEQIVNVPEGFAGLMFLLGLLESCLVKILVLDERVAGVVFDVEVDDGNFGFRPSRHSWFSSYRIAGLFMAPFFQWKKNETQGLFCHITSPKLVYKFRNDPINDLGVILELKEHEDVRIESCTPIGKDGWAGGRDDLTSPPYDAVVVHRGLLEALAEAVGVTSAEAFLGSVLDALHAVGARVIVTSGRGVQPGRRASDYPFLEYSVLEATVVREFSKPSLVGSLMAV